MPTITPAGFPNPPVTSAEIDALPDRMRQYIHMLETDCDPAGTIRELAHAYDVIRELVACLA